MMLRPLLLIALASGACAHTTATFSPSGADRFPARPAGCALDAFVTPPSRPFQEIGVFDVRNRGLDQAGTLDRLRALVNAQACQAGADGIIAAANGVGIYVQAVAFRWTAPAPGQSVPPPQ
ncbi:MAG: hypothetical protein K8W52_11600 [Deltaproteobacteria bacterium]|nr:hypothetical protein [Deltaproteobacteria bacterium]